MNIPPNFQQSKHGNDFDVTALNCSRPKAPQNSRNIPPAPRHSRWLLCSAIPEAPAFGERPCPGWELARVFPALPAVRRGSTSLRSMRGENWTNHSASARIDNERFHVSLTRTISHGGGESSFTSWVLARVFSVTLQSERSLFVWGQPPSALPGSSTGQRGGRRRTRCKSATLQRAAVGAVAMALLSVWF